MASRSRWLLLVLLLLPFCAHAASIGPIRGGGGSGMTETVVTQASVAQDEVLFVSHPAAALGTSVPIVAINWTSTDVGDQTTGLNWDTEWTIEDLSNGGTWVQDAGLDGHFTVAPDATVTAGCGVSIGGVGRLIDAYAGDGTAASSVTLNVATASGALTWIRGLYTDGFSKVRNYNSGVAGNPVAWYVASYTGQYSAVWSDWKTFTTTALAAAGAEVKIAFQLETGGSYYYFANASGTWETMDITSQADWASKGCVVSNGGPSNLGDDTGVAITDAQFDAIGLLPNGSLVVVVGLKPAAAAAAELQGTTQFTYRRSRTMYESFRGPDAFSGDWSITRTSSTDMAIQYLGAGATDVVVSVRTN